VSVKSLQLRWYARKWKRNVLRRCLNITSDGWCRCRVWWKTVVLEVGAGNQKSPFADGREVEQRYSKLVRGSRLESLPGWHIAVCLYVCLYLGLCVEWRYSAGSRPPWSLSVCLYVCLSVCVFVSLSVRRVKIFCWIQTSMKLVVSTYKRSVNMSNMAKLRLLVTHPARQAGTRFTHPRGMEDWVDLGGEVVNLIPTCRCNGIWETTRHNRHNGLLSAPSCCGLAAGELL